MILEEQYKSNQNQIKLGSPYQTWHMKLSANTETKQIHEPTTSCNETIAYRTP
jgi:hypothetical protein